MDNNQNGKTKYFIIAVLALIFSIAGLILGIYSLRKQVVSPSKILGITSTAEQEEDPDFTFSSSRTWHLKGTSQKNYSTINLHFKIKNSRTPDNSPVYQIESSIIKGSFEKSSEGEYIARIPTSKIEPGSYKISASAEFGGKKYKADPVQVKVSYPVYVVWTMDWEGGDTPDTELANLHNFSDKYKVPITQFFNPSLYTGTVSTQRADYLTNWLLDREAAGDEIGMHLHMHKTLVKAAGLEPKEKPQWTNYLDNGHDVPCTAYSYKEFKQILEWSINKFEENGLGKPVSFRAGGWFADLDNLKALQDTGFLIDSSGREFYIWGSPDTKITGPWNLSTTTQPYPVSASNQNISAYPNLNLWEFPNNGGDSLYYTSDVLIDRFNTNYPQKILSEYRVVTYLTHPHEISKDIQVLDPVYKHLNKSSIERDKGPVIYTTLLDTYNDIVLNK
ncbi:MAG: hypothetical protein PHS44_00805 [Candidatus Dojkabacteria bacterium]|nr:hypothetical protein [Candidatus Dojkabacteria bacterium]